MKGAGLALFLVALAGCIERTLVVESEPSGLEVRVNGTPVGRTPVEVGFRHYGVYSVELEGGGVRAAFEERVLAPWYACFPLDVFSELLLPVRIRDVRYFFYEFKDTGPVPREGLLRRAEKAFEEIGAEAVKVPAH